MLGGQRGGMMDGGKGMDSGMQQKKGDMKGGMMGMGGAGAQRMSGTMHDMSRQMMGLSQQMLRGNMSAEQQKQIAKRLRTMAGMAGKGMMMNEDMQKQMQEIRKQMDQMMMSPATAPKR